MTKDITIHDLKFDQKNANKHTEQGNRLLEKSLSKLGFGRSILLDKDNNIIAGNGVSEKAGELGFEKVRIIETDGTEIIAVKRKDVSINSKKGRELAIADNQTAKAGINFDFEVINDLNSEFDFDFTNEWELPSFESINEDELNNFFEDDNSEPKEEQFKIVLNYTEEDYEIVKKELLKYGKSYESAVYKLLNLE